MEGPLDPRQPAPDGGAPQAAGHDDDLHALLERLLGQGDVRPVASGTDDLWPDLFTATRDDVSFLDITPELPKMQEISEVYEEGVIPAATYGLPADASTIVVPNLLLVRDDLDANLACVLTKTLFERQPQLAEVVGAAKGIKLDEARETDPVPLNRGAEVALEQLSGSS